MMQSHRPVLSLISQTIIHQPFHCLQSLPTQMSLLRSCLLQPISAALTHSPHGLLKDSFETLASFVTSLLSTSLYSGEFSGLARSVLDQFLSVFYHLPASI